jgi:predicted ester cyclase
MTPREMKALHDEHLAAESRQDLDAVMATYHDDCYHESKAAGLRFVGKPAVRLQYERLYAAFTDVAPTQEVEAFGEDLLMDRGLFRAHQTGELWGMAPTGQRVEVPFARAVLFKDGLIHAEIAYFDFAALCEQLGISLQEGRSRTKVIAEALAASAAAGR